MPPLNQPKTLCSLSADALCQYIYLLVNKGTTLTELTDNVLQGAEQELVKIIAGKAWPSRVSMDTSYKAALYLQSIQAMIQKNGSVPDILSRNLEKLPAGFANEIINKMLVSVSKVIVNDDEEIENFLDDEWSFGLRMRTGLHVILRSMLSLKVSTLNFSPLSNKFCKVFAEYFLKPEQEYDHLIHDIEEKKDELFIDTIFYHKDNIVNVTSLSLQNLASPKLIWAICCCCPNLWHLDISGELYDIASYCITKRDAVSPDDSDVDKGNDTAEFVYALGGIYGLDTDNNCTLYFDGTPQVLDKLKMLHLPEVEYCTDDEFYLNYHGSSILHYCRDLEEITGVNLYVVLYNFMNFTKLPPLLKLKKFQIGKWRKNKYLDQNIFKEVRLPCVTEVDIAVDTVMGLEMLDHFPNMKYLKVTPLTPSIYSCSSILSYLGNLHTFDVEFEHEMSMTNVCQIAECCKYLESFKLNCPALRLVEVNGEEQNEGASVNTQSAVKKKGDAQMEADTVSNMQSPIERKSEKDSETVSVKTIPLSEGCVHDKPVSCKSAHEQQSFPKYMQSWLNIDSAPYERENHLIPKFSKLHSLMFYGMHSFDIGALYKCIRGSPHIHTFSFVALQNGTVHNKDIDNDFVGRVTPLLKCVQDFTLGAETRRRESVVLDRLTAVAVEHVVNLCKNIQSIGNIASWNMTYDEMNTWNNRFKMQNYILRLH